MAADLARRLAVARGDEPADVVVRGGRVLTVDEDRLRARAQEAADRIRVKNAAAWTFAAEMAPYLSTACRAVAAAPYPVNRYAAPVG
jgi:hypothetical protein